METQSSYNNRITEMLSQLLDTQKSEELTILLSLSNEINYLISKIEQKTQNETIEHKLPLLEKLLDVRIEKTQNLENLIKELKSQNEELIVSKEKAEESDKLKSEFLNNISHEVRTPLNGVIGFSDILKHPGIEEEKKKEFLNIIYKSSRQLLEIFNDILEISKLDLKKVTVDKNKVCLNSLLNDITKDFRKEVGGKSLDLLFKPGLKNCKCVIFTDFFKLKKAINKILENAVKFTPNGRIEIGYRMENNFIEIYIKDTGIGIKKEVGALIFKSFSQGDKGLNRSYGGLGVGLSIAQKNIHLIGGNIRFESVEGKGTTFYISLPYKPADAICNE